MTNATTNGAFPRDARTAAELYLGRGLAPIPVPYRSKNPTIEGWPRLRLALADLDAYFPPGQPLNLGVLNGAPSDLHHDVDLDCPEAIQAAPLLLPPTGMVFGRKSARRSHRIFKCDQIGRSHV